MIEREDNQRALELGVNLPIYPVNPFTGLRGASNGQILVLGVKRLPEWGEYKVTVKVGDSYDEGKADYIPLDSKGEVSASLLSSYEWAKKNGYQVSFTKGAMKFLK